MSHLFHKIGYSLRHWSEVGITMQRKLTVYFACTVLVVFVAAVVLIRTAGIMPGSERNLGETLAVQHQNTFSAMTKQMDLLTARSIRLSEEITWTMEQVLIEHGKTFEDVNDNPQLILDLEDSLYGALETVLRSNVCSGAFFILDATVNTRAEAADTSRMGVYLRFSDLKAVGTANQHMVYFRGAADIARKKQIQMHNRWDLEFDTALVSCYETLLNFNQNRLAEGAVWTERFRLRDTWEDVILLCIPILDQNGVPCGICGVELSQLYFALSYPAAESQFGNMVTLLAPAEGRKYDLSKAMIGNAAGTYLKPAGLFNIRSGKYYQTASTEAEHYFGLSSPLDVRLCSGQPPMVLTLLPEDSYYQASHRIRQIWFAGTAVFLILILLLAGGVSGHFSAPIVRSLNAMQQRKIGEDGQNARIRSGISEIDALVSFLQTRSEELKTRELPPEIDTMLQEFKVRVGKLTPAERMIFQLFIDGCDVQAAAERSFVSVATVRKHNTSINRKMEVVNREELMVYVDLFRRCGRLEELKNG